MLNIVFISDANFLLPLTVSITSLLEERKETNYSIYVIGISLDDQSREVIRNTGMKYSTSIKVIDVDADAISERYKTIGNHECCANISALVKFDIPNLIESDKALYLDSDIVVQKDLKELEEFILPDGIYGATVLESGLLYNKNIIDKGNDKYFNSGVMLLNLEAMRKDDVSRKLYLAKIASKDVSLMDQHVFNEIFSGHTISLEHKYNVLFTSIVRATFFHRLELARINELFGTKYNSLDNILQEAAIVHYSTFDKPWKYSDVSGVEKWDNYYKKTLFSKRLLQRKRLNIRIVYWLMKNKYTKLLGMFYWKCKTKGFIFTFKESIRYVADKI